MKRDQVSPAQRARGNAESGAVAPGRITGVQAAEQGVPQGIAAGPGKSSLTERFELQLMGGQPANAGSPDTLHRSAADGVAVASQPLPYLATLQPLFGRHDLSSVRAEVGGAAATAADEVGAVGAYAYGDRVAFAKSPDLRTVAHEAAHVIQQRIGVTGLDAGIGRGGDRWEQHADAVADAVVAGQSAEPLLDQLGANANATAVAPAVQRDAPKTKANTIPSSMTAYQYLAADNYLEQTLREMLLHTSLVTKGPFTKYVRDVDQLQDKLLEVLVGNRKDLESRLYRLVMPDKLDTLIDRSRARDWEQPDEKKPAVKTDKGPGTDTFLKSVVLEIANSLARSYKRSIERVFPRVLGQYLLKKNCEQPAPTAPLSASFVQVADVLVSHPMDTVVATTLCAKQIGINFDLAAKEHPELASNEVVLDRETTLKRPMGLFRWVEAVPPDRTAEEVAKALFGERDQAHRLIPKPPLWGFWAHDIPDMRSYRSLHPHMYVERPGPRKPYKPGQENEPYEDAPNDIAAALGGLVGGSSEEVDPVTELLARGPSRQVQDHAKATLKPGGETHDEANIIAMLTDNLEVVTPLLELVPVFDKSPASIEALRTRLVQRRQDARNTCLADPETWYLLAAEQSKLLGQISTGLAQAAASLIENGGPATPENLRAPIMEVVEPYMQALAALDLPDIATTRVKVAEQKLAMLGISIEEAKLHEGLGNVDFALGSNAKVGERDYDPSYALGRTNNLLFTLADARTSKNPDDSNKVLAAVKPKVDNLEFEITLADKLVRLDALWKAIDNEEDWWESETDRAVGRLLKTTNRLFYATYYSQVYVPFMVDAKKEQDPDKQNALRQAAKDKFRDIFNGKESYNGKNFIEHGKEVIAFLKRVAKHKKWTKIIVGIAIAFAAFMLGQWAFSAMMLEAAGAWAVAEAAVVGGLVTTGAQVTLEKIFFGHNPTLGNVLTGFVANTAIFFIVGKMALAARAAGIEAEVGSAVALGDAGAGAAVADATGAAAKGTTVRGAAKAVGKYGAGLVKEMIIAETLGIVQGNVASLIDRGRMLTGAEMQEMFVQQIAGVIGMRVAQHGFDASIKEFHRVKQEGISRDVQWLGQEQTVLHDMGMKLHEEAKANPEGTSNKEAVQEFLGRWREYMERERATREKILTYSEKHPGRLNSKAVNKLRESAGNAILEAQLAKADAMISIEQTGPNSFRCDARAFELVMAQHKSAGHEIVSIHTETETGRRTVTIQAGDGTKPFTIKENLPPVNKRTAMNISVNEAAAFEPWLDQRTSPLNLTLSPGIEALRDLYLKDPRAAIAVAAEKYGYRPHEVKVDQPYVVKPETQAKPRPKDGGFVSQAGTDAAAMIGEVTAIADNAFIAAPGKLTELRAEWQSRHGHEPSKIHYDAETNSVHFEAKMGKGAEAKGIKISAELGPKIRAFDQLDSGVNRIVGEPVSIAEGYDILRALTRGDATALEKVGLGGESRMPADPHVEFGLGVTSDGRAVIIRGEPGAVDWAHMPGLKPAAHTHPPVPGNDLLPNIKGEKKVAITDLLSVTKDPSINRELIMPSAPDFVVMAHLGVKGHMVFTSFVKKGEYLVKALPGDTSPRVEFVIHESTEVGTLPDGRRVYKTDVEGFVGKDSFIREDIWVVQDKPDGSGNLHMERPGALIEKPPAGGTTTARTPTAAPVDIAATQATLQKAAADHIAQGKPPALPYEVRVDPDFAINFRSSKALAVFKLDGDKAVIHTSPKASPGDVIQELYHLRQMEDPVMAAEIRRHSGADMGKWDTMSAADRVEHFRRKLRIEIDAHEKMVHDEILGADRTLADLRKIENDINKLTPEDIVEMNAGLKDVDPMIADPAHLFGKSKHVVGDRPARDGTFKKKNTAAVDKEGPERSTAYNDGEVTSVRQLGRDWVEELRITADQEGQVSVQSSRNGKTVVITTAKGEHRYPLEPGTEPAVKSGRVKVGDTLAVETNRRYRLVEIEYTNGSKKRREEIRRNDHDQHAQDADPGGWIQRGSDSTRAGRIMEDAAVRQANAKLGARKRANPDFDYVHIEHSRGGGGFDDVIVEFTTKDGTISARVRIREVKDYPDRYVSKSEFTAISGEGFLENLRGLERIVEKAIKVKTGDAGAAIEGFSKDITVEHLEAVDRALKNKNQVDVEIVLGPDTLLGAHDGPGASVIKDLKNDIKKRATLKTAPEYVDQKHVETATQHEKP
jgi:hypothetical protein